MTALYVSGICNKNIVHLRLVKLSVSFSNTTPMAECFECLPCRFHSQVGPYETKVVLVEVVLPCLTLSVKVVLNPFMDWF